MIIKALDNVWDYVNMKLVVPGETVDLPDDAANSLIAIKAAEAVKGATPKPTPQPSN